MPTNKITDTAIRAMPAEGETYLWDTDLKGFGVRSTGPAKTFIVKYRVGGGDGRQRKYKLGLFGTLNTTEARARARDVLQAVARGEDPAGERSEARASPTLKELFPVFLAEHVAAKRKPRTLSAYQDIADRHVLPALGMTKVRELRPSHVEKLHSGMSKTPITANRAMALLSKFCTWCEGRELRDVNTNPCKTVERFQENKRERFLSASEIERLNDVLDASIEEPIAAVAAIRLLMLTGARHREITTMTWAMVDVKRGVARLTDSKTGARNLFLNPAALAVLDALPRRNSTPYVIFGRRPGSHLVGLQNVWERIRKKADLEDVRIHDLRHTYASIAILEHGANLSLVGRALGHKSPLTTARYAHLADDPVQALAHLVGSKIAGVKS